MSDIVEQLRREPTPWLFGPAADEIEHLRAENHDRLRANKALVAENDSLRADNANLLEAAKVAVKWNERLRAERQAFADELYELRNRAGCGPEQAGLDIWQQKAELLAALTIGYEWMREPDYAERADLEWLTEWVNRRPLAECGSIFARLSSAEVPVSLRIKDATEPRPAITKAESK